MREALVQYAVWIRVDNPHLAVLNLDLLKLLGEPLPFFGRPLTHLFVWHELADWRSG